MDLEREMHREVTKARGRFHHQKAKERGWHATKVTKMSSILFLEIMNKKLDMISLSLGKLHALDTITMDMLGIRDDVN